MPVAIKVSSMIDHTKQAFFESNDGGVILEPEELQAFDPFNPNRHILKVIQTLEAYSSEDEKESRDTKFIIEMCRAYPDIFNAHFYPGHITGSALIVALTKREVLLHYHLSIGKWLQFGGHSEEEITPWQIAYREAIEETSLTDIKFFPAVQPPNPLDIDVHTISEHNGTPQHYHLDFRYLFLTKHPESVVISSESREYRWVNFDAVDGMDLDYALRRLIDKAKKTLYG